MSDQRMGPTDLDPSVEQFIWFCVEQGWARHLGGDGDAAEFEVFGLPDSFEEFMQKVGPLYEAARRNEEAGS